MAVLTVIEAVREAMAEEMRRDFKVFILGEDIGKRGGVFLATLDLMKEFGSNRVIDTPVAESSIAGIAMGAAMQGMRPVAEIQFADFIWPTMNQLVGEAARARYGTEGDVNVPMVIRCPSGGHVRGGLFHSQSVEAYFAHTPGLKVVAPSTPYDAKGLLKAAIRDNDPVIFLEHKRTYRSVRGQVPDEEYLLPIGIADIKRTGSNATLITYGLTVHYSLQAADLLAKEGIEVEVIDLRTIRPLDDNMIMESVRKTGRVLIVHEDNRTGGIGAELSARISEAAFTDLDAPVMRCTGPDVPAMPFAPTLEDTFMPTSDKILTALRQLLEY